MSERAREKMIVALKAAQNILHVMTRPDLHLTTWPDEARPRVSSHHLWARMLAAEKATRDALEMCGSGLANGPDVGVAAIHDVIAERNRQIDDEGFTGEHDDGHAEDELAAAGACYANPFKIEISGDGIFERPLMDGEVPLGWPGGWDDVWWTPKTRRQDLVRAGALIIAEIERLDRAGAKREAVQ